MESDHLHKQIRAIPFMNGLTNPARAAFVSAVESVGQQENVPKGTVLFQQGSHGAAMGCIVLSGQIRISKPNSPDLVCYAPELLGETKQINPHAQRNATVDALTELDVIKFNWTSLESQLAQIAAEMDVKAIEKALEDYSWRHITE